MEKQETKICSICKVEYLRTSEYFHRSKKNKDGFDYRCKKCRSIIRKKQYNKPEVKEKARLEWKLKMEDPEFRKKRNQQQRLYYERNKEKIREIRNKQYNKNPEAQKKKQEYGKEYRNRPEVKEHRKEKWKIYSQKPEVQERRKEWRLNNQDKIKESIKKHHRKKAIQEIEHHIYVYDSNGKIEGFKREYFYKKYPKGDRSKNIYEEIKWKEKASEIINRDKNACRDCLQFGDEVHHLRSFYYNPEIALKDSNLITLCHDCHNLYTKGIRDETYKRRVDQQIRIKQRFSQKNSKNYH